MRQKVTLRFSRVLLLAPLAAIGITATIAAGCGSHHRTIDFASPTPGASPTPTPVPTATPTPGTSGSPGPTPTPTPTPTPLPVTPTFTVTELSYKGQSVNAVGLNNAGQFTGTVDDANTSPPPLLLNTNGVYQDLSPSNSTGEVLYAHDLNDAGNFVGSFGGDTPTTASGKGYRPFVVENGVYRALDIYTGIPCNATAINNKEQIVGNTISGSVGSYGDSSGYLYDNGTVTNLGFLYGSTPPARIIGQSGSPSIPYETNPLDINDAGQIVGESTTASGDIHAFLWQNGKMTDLYPAASGRAYAINNKGQAVGFAGVGNYGDAALFEDGGARALPVTFNGVNAVESSGTDINDAGQIVGTFRLPSGTQYPRAFFYDHGVLIDLSALLPRPYADVSTVAINNQGQILISISGDSSYLLTPVTSTKAAKAVGIAKAPATSISKSGGSSGKVAGKR